MTGVTPRISPIIDEVLAMNGREPVVSLLHRWLGLVLAAMLPTHVAPGHRDV